MKCPVCKTECFEKAVCSECGFIPSPPTFINQADAEEWMHTVVESHRYQYWKRLDDFEIVDKTLIKYLGAAENVAVPYGIENIGENAFIDNQSIINVFLPDTVKVIGLCAFADTHLETISLPQGLEKIEALAFENTNLRHIVIPGSCKVIEDEAFTCCMNLKSAVILQGVTTLQRLAFHCCIDLEYVVIPESLITIEEGVFATQCPKTRIITDIRNPRYYFQDCCLIDRLSKTIIAGFLDDEDRIEIPNTEGVNIIGAWAFTGQETEYVVSLPANIKEIESDAFRNCGDLSIVLPHTVQIIRAQSFGATTCNIYCEASRKPSAWDRDWLGDGSKLLSAEKNVYWHGEWNNCPDMPLPEQMNFEDLPF